MFAVFLDLSSCGHEILQMQIHKFKFIWLPKGVGHFLPFVLQNFHPEPIPTYAPGLGGGVTLTGA